MGMHSQLKSFLIYGIGTVSTSILGFVLLPLYLNKFPAEQFGVVNILLLVTTFASMFLNAGVMSALHKQYFVIPGNERAELVGQVVVWYLGVSLLIGIVTSTLAGPISAGLFQTADHAYEVRLLGPIVFLTLTVDVPFNVLRLEGKPREFVILSIIRLLIETALKYLFIIALERGVRGYFESSLISLAMANAIVYVATRRQVRLRVRLEHLRILLRLGIPFIFSGFAIWSLDAMARLVLNYMEGAGAVGLYSTAQRFAQVFSLILFQPVSLLMPPFVFSYVAAHSEEESKAFFIKLFAVLAIAGTAVLVVICASSPDIIRVLVRYLGTRGEYAAAQGLIVPLTFANFFYFMTMPAGYVALWISKTRILAIASTVTAAINAGTTYLFVRIFGPAGAALAFGFSYLLYLVISLFALNRHKLIRYPVGLALFQTVLALGCIGVTRAIPVQSPLLSLFVKTGTAVLLFAVGTWLIGLRIVPGLRKQLKEKAGLLLSRLRLGHQ